MEGDNPVIEQNLDDEEEDEVEVNIEDESKKFLNLVRENKTEEALEQFEKYKGKIIENYEVENWNALLWASCNGNEEIVNLLLERNVHHQYTDTKNDETVEVGDDNDGEYNPF